MIGSGFSAFTDVRAGPPVLRTNPRAFKASLRAGEFLVRATPSATQGRNVRMFRAFRGVTLAGVALALGFCGTLSAGDCAGCPKFQFGGAHGSSSGASQGGDYWNQTATSAPSGVAVESDGGPVSMGGSCVGGRCGLGGIAGGWPNYGLTHPFTCQYRDYGPPDLFRQYYQGNNCDGHGAELYIAPRPVPPHVGHTFYTYQPFYPHEMMYPHGRKYYRYYDQGRGYNRTHVRWGF